MDVDACCEYCYQYARVPFEVCWYCGDRPCYHHGRCCPLKPRPAAKAVVTAGLVDRDVSQWIVQDVVTGTGSEAGIDVPNDDGRVVFPMT